MGGCDELHRAQRSSISGKTTTGELKVVMIVHTTKFVKGTAVVTVQDIKVGDRAVTGRQQAVRD